MQAGRQSDITLEQYLKGHILFISMKQREKERVRERERRGRSVCLLGMVWAFERTHILLQSHS